jgi:biofilm PGA synthesis N-glycosyltransferase PgaC
MEVISALGYFVLFYPVCMVAVWIVGGLLFRIRWENRKHAALNTYPFVSIIVPAHNEERVIYETIEHLRDLDYPNYEVIVVNDGSTDSTKHILDYLLTYSSDWLKVLHLRPNNGKAIALNWAILFSRGEYIVVIDADCILKKDALQFFMPHFASSSKVGAVTGNPRVRNRTTLLGKIQVGEYSYIIGMIKRTQRIYGKILTVSGAIAAYRKSALLDVGLFDSDTVTEDIDITWKLHRGFWDVRYEPRALCWVLVPKR